MSCFFKLKILLWIYFFCLGGCFIFVKCSNGEDLIKSNKCLLEGMDLKDTNSLTSKSLDGDFDSILKRLYENDPSLTDVYLSGCEIDDKKLEMFSNALKGNLYLKFADLSFNKITSSGVVFLSLAIEQNSSLECLNLSFNSLGSKAVFDFFKCLDSNPHLVNLNLSGTGFNSKKSIDSLYSLLKNKNSKLRFLDLSNNVVGDFGAIYIAKGLENNTVLEYINLDNTKIEKTGLELLQKVFERSETIKYCYLVDNTL